MVTQQRLKECLEYNADTGVFKWKERPLGHFKSKRAMNSFNAKHNGRTAGSERTRKGLAYSSIGIDGKVYFAHRLAWLYIYGRFPSLHIDHINGNGTDNRISNLRDVSQGENTRNRRLPRNNRTGVVGVKRYGSYDLWIAQINHNNKRYHLGYFKDFFEAVCARKSQELFFNFSENHGRTL